MDLVNCLAYVSNQLTSAPPAAVDEDLEQYRALLRGKIDVAPRGTVEGLTYAQDGVMYKDGYRIEKFDDERLDQLNVKIRELEKKSHEKDQKLDQLNVKLQELERKSAEREMVIDELRSRSASRAVSPMPSTSRSSGVFRDIPKILLDEGESQPGSKKFRPIHREDELRRTIKKRSVSSNVSEDRTEELEALSQLEDDEASQMDDYVPLVYAREDEPNSSGMKHKISPIQELCAMHETEERQRTMERSPEPAMAAGDISESKEKSLIHSSKVILIEEDIRDSDSSALEDNDALLSQRASPRNTLPELPQLTKEMFLTTSESVPSNLSSHSNSPDPDQPYLKRTRKKSDLTALLLDEERKTSAFSGVIIQTVEYESEEDVDRTEFMQSKSPSPYVGAFLDNERLESTGQLIPLVSDLPKSTSSEERSSSQELLQKSTESAIGQSRNASSSPAPIGSSGSPASPVSSIVDDSIKDGPSHAGDDRLTSSPTPSDRNLIFSGEYTKAMSKDWHSGHFCCWQCDESLTGQRYVLRDEHPYCIKCYENVFANICEECNKTIGIDSKDLSYKDKHWHEACFLCNKCRISLVDKQFGSKADKIYCGNCYDAQFASRCDGCGEIFRAGTKKMEYKTRQWHEKCFCCCVCKTAIGTKSFIPREQEIYCAGCYEEKYATRCIKCKKIITSGGVTYKNEPWHRECFTCSHCQVSLAGQRFTSRDEKPYCAECFGELFAKRCTSCTKPITGIGGTRFISFEDRHWHNDCFICAICKTSLVGRGFITDEQDVICPECAKQKLM
ncbi:paxillin isoform X4 [Wyeomyia smithii]|uniref:paxillin isoform X4 n=2 Tax=Wyeomyia smithii TaxID=174621 RepID=UPI002467D966|nr:paxillin isoform X4 [Wyeomyia smithii]